MGRERCRSVAVRFIELLCEGLKLSLGGQFSAQGPANRRARRLPSLSLKQFGSRIRPAFTGSQKYIPPVQAIVQALQNTKGIEFSVQTSIWPFHQLPPRPSQYFPR